MKQIAELHRDLDMTSNPVKGPPDMIPLAWSGHIEHKLSNPRHDGSLILFRDSLPILRLMPNDTDFEAQDSLTWQKWRHFLPGDNWNRFLKRWDRALIAARTPLSFSDTARFVSDTIEIWGEPIQVIRILSENHANRDSFMARQPKYTPRRAADSYVPHLLVDSCQLCENVIRAVESGPEHSLADLGTHLLLPNRYPQMPGACLLIPRKHDPLERRLPVAPCGTISEPHVSNATYGKVLDYSELALLATISREYGLFVYRNHPLDGMSIPEHDHAHGLPLPLPPAQLALESIRELEAHPLGRPYFQLKRSPCDSLVVKAHSLGETIKRTEALVQAMELNQRVFTLAYLEGAFVISPRKTELLNGIRTQIGPGASFGIIGWGTHWAKEIERVVPRRGTYDWQTLISARISSRAAAA